MGRRSLQVLTAVLATVPVVTGIVGMAGVKDPLYALAIAWPLSDPKRPMMNDRQSVGSIKPLD